MVGLLCGNRQTGVVHTERSHMYLIIYSFHAVHVNIRANSHPDILGEIILLTQCDRNKWAVGCELSS